MTLADLRARFKDHLYDTGTPYWADDTRNDRYINDAMQHVANAIAGQRADDMTIMQEFALPAATGSRTVVAVDSSSWTYPRIRRARLLIPREQSATTIPIGEPVTLTEAAAFIANGAEQEECKYWVQRETLHLIQPDAGFEAVLFYVPGLPRMTDPTNQPGQTGAGNTGLAILSENFQPLIAVYAALLARNDEGSDVTDVLAIVRDMQQVVGLELLAKRVQA